MVIDHLVISAEQFAQRMHDPQYRDLRVELVAGEIITMPKPKRRHGFTSNKMGFFLESYAQQNGGVVYANETGVVTVERPDGRDTVRGVDLAYFKTDDGDYDEFIRSAPDVAVEVLSPGNEAIDIDQKIAEYLAMGTALVWVINPTVRTVMAYSQEDVQRYTDADTLDAGDVLPGFAVAVRALFPPVEGGE